MTMASGWANDAPYDQEFETVWRELYNAEDPKCPVSLVVRKAARRRRPEYVNPEEFDTALPGRIYQKLKANFRKARKAGVAVEDWRRKIGKLSRTADCAALEESRKIRTGCRSTVKPEFEPLDDRDSCADFTQDSQATLGRVALAQACDCDSEPIQGFMRGELHTGEILKHVRACENCRIATEIINNGLANFVDTASSHEISPKHVQLIKHLGLRTGAIQFLLHCLDADEVGNQEREHLAMNLGALGYRGLLRNRRRATHYGTESRDHFLRTLVRASTLLLLVRRDTRATWVRLAYIIRRRSEATLSKTIFVGSIVNLFDEITLCMMDHDASFDRFLTNAAKRRLTNPTESTRRSNPPCAHEIV